MDYLPISLRLRGQPVVLVGAGTVAYRRAENLLSAGAQLTVIAPERDARFSVLAEQNEFMWRSRDYEPGDLKGAALAIAATSDPEVNRAVHNEATHLGLPVNVVDNPDLCTFIFPAIVDRSPLTVSISSSGGSPAVARSIRARIEAILPMGTSEIARFGRSYRDRIRDAEISEDDRRRIWESIVDGSIAQLLLSNRWQAAEQRLADLLSHNTASVTGEAYLIGAGPGDPELMTFKALRLLQRADVVLHDRLVNPEIVAMARRDAQKLYVGKRRSEHSVPQETINKTLVSLAKEGKVVARLKGGDPFVFGRGGEEIEELAREGIAFQVVPGITAANAAACYSGIPLTHRDYAQSVRFVTGHTKDGKLQHRWEEFLSDTETLVFYMGLVGLKIICEQLIAHGRDPDTPLALVERATSPDQRLLTGTLATAAELVESTSPQPPTLIIVGKIVELADTLRWYGAG
ncbi:MAG: siroheme synthase CysG [Pseudomonadota bacterium]